MGALHIGHLGLVAQARAENDICVVSIFVNPTQFNEREDLVKYPRPIEQDIAKLAAADCEVLFLPTVDEVYPVGIQTKFDFGLEKFNAAMEGILRPGHFDGVAEVVKRLLDIVKPDTIYMGQKDFQQSLIVQKLVTDFGMNTEVIVSPTIREEDGLALSSRNVRLNDEEREAAGHIPKVLFEARDTIKSQLLATNSQPLATIIEESSRKLNEHPLISVDYFEAVNADTLERLSTVEKGVKVAVCVAVRIGPIRLIDNIII